MIKALPLSNRRVLHLSGPDTVTFLQGLITNDVARVTDRTPIYAGMLTPQGKYLFDFLIFSDQSGGFYLDIDDSDLTDLQRRLMIYRLRANVEITDVSDGMQIWAFSDHNESIALDPRSSQLGGRAILDNAPKGTSEWAFDDYNDRRIKLGIPDAQNDMIRDKYFWLECGAERLNGVDFHKGCYVGQEQTARMKHRATIKKGLLPFQFSGKPPAKDSDILNGAGKVIGRLHSIGDTHAIGFVRFEKMDEALTADGVPLLAAVLE